VYSIAPMWRLQVSDVLLLKSIRDALPGGGVAWSRCVAALDKLKLEGDEQIGVNIVKRALQEPLCQIVP
jgi:chaperonin GroEL (HSP60 family)